MADAVTSRRRWFKFSLRTFLLTWMAAAVWLGWWIHAARQQREAVANIQSLTSTWWSKAASIDYSYQIVDEERPDTRPNSDPNAASWAPRFALKSLGKDSFHNVVSVFVWRSKQGKELELAVELARLRNLRRLVFLYVDVTDAMVERLAGLRQLQSLELHGDALSDEALRLISSLPRLQALRIRGDFTDAGLAHLKRVRTLKSLEIDSPHITDQGLAHLSRLLDLELLSLSSTQLTEQGFEKLAACTKLSILSLRPYWYVTDDDLRGIAANSALEDLDFSATNITDVGVQHLSGLTNLRRLDLTNARITNDAMPFIARLTNLVEIELGGTRLTDDAIPFLAQLPKLEEIDLDDARVTTVGLEQFKASPKLRSLQVFSTFRNDLINLLTPFAKPRGFNANDVNRLKQALPGCTVYYY